MEGMSAPCVLCLVPTDDAKESIALQKLACRLIPEIDSGRREVEK